MLPLFKRIIIILFLGAVFFVIVNNNVIWFNMPSLEKYPIRGVDVSAHQGNIQWEILSKQNIHFAFIKATEGSGWVDKKFRYNFDSSIKNGICAGAYHFFSFDSSGEKQAQNFINNVPKIPNYKRSCILPPVVDLEFYGNKASNPPSKDSIYKELDILLNKLEKHYNKKPIIYTTISFYKEYLSNRYTQYPLWIRSIFFAPDSAFAKLFDMYFDKNQWFFWQYNPKGILNGYKDGEKFIDFNVFNGGYEEFKDFLSTNN